MEPPTQAIINYRAKLSQVTISSGMASLILQSLSKEPSLRPRVEKLVSGFEHLITKERTLPQPLPAVKRPQNQSTHHKVKVILTTLSADDLILTNSSGDGGMNFSSHNKGSRSHVVLVDDNSSIFSQQSSIYYSSFNSVNDTPPSEGVGGGGGVVGTGSLNVQQQTGSLIGGGTNHSRSIGRAAVVKSHHSHKQNTSSIDKGGDPRLSCLCRAMRFQKCGQFSIFQTFVATGVLIVISLCAAILGIYLSK